jgi:hypothetical protein
MSFLIDEAAYELRYNSLTSRLLRLQSDSSLTETVIVRSHVPVFQVNEEGKGIKAEQDGVDIDRHFADCGLHAASLHLAVRMAMHKVNADRMERSMPLHAYYLELRQHMVIKQTAHAETLIEAKVLRRI